MNESLLAFFYNYLFFHGLIVIIYYRLAYLMPTRATFIVYCLMLRSVTAIGSSCTLTASLTIISEVFQKNRAFAFVSNNSC